MLLENAGYEGQGAGLVREALGGEGVAADDGLLVGEKTRHNELQILKV